MVPFSIYKACWQVSVVNEVLYLRYDTATLKLRFWPNPFVKIMEENSSSWRHAPEAGDAFLERSLDLMATAVEPQQSIFMFDLHTQDRHPRWSLERALEVFWNKIPLRVRRFICVHWVRGSSGFIAVARGL